MSGAIATIDRLLDHTSEMPALRGESVQLFLREKVREELIGAPDGKDRAGIVLMVHGGYWPGTTVFDLDHPGYSWMEALAAAGFDVFAIDMTGYGGSSRPMMDDPGNLSAEHQEILVPRTLAAPRAPSFPWRLATSDSEAADLDRAVDFIRDLRGADRVNLIGYSGGGIRTGTYTLRHPEKVARLVIWSSSNYAEDGPDGPPASLPEPGVPMLFQTRAVGFGERWFTRIGREGQVETGLPEIAWAQSMATDPVGAGWGPGGLRGPTRTYWGWNAKAASGIATPTLVMSGEYDTLFRSNVALFGRIGAAEKVFLGIGAGSHFMNWEKQRAVLHRASIDWLKNESLVGRTTGTFWADFDANIAERPIA